MEKAWVCFATLIYGKNLIMCQVEMAASTGQTHLNPNRERTLHDGAYLFPTDWRWQQHLQNLRLVTLELAIVRPEVAAFIPAIDGRQGLDLQGQTEQLNESVSILLIVHIFFSE
jgi:hypothetical protein